MMIELFGLVALFGLFVFSYNMAVMWKKPAPLNLPVAVSSPKREEKHDEEQRETGETRTFFIHLDGHKYPLNFSKAILDSHGEEIADILKILLESLKVLENGSNLNQIVTKAWLAEKSIDRLVDLALITPTNGSSLVRAMDRFVDRRIEGQFAPMSEKANVASLNMEMDESLQSGVGIESLAPEEEALFEKVGASRRTPASANSKSALEKALFVFENFVYTDAPAKEQKLGVFRQQLSTAGNAA